MKTKYVFLLLLSIVVPNMYAQFTIPIFKHNADRSKPFSLVVNYEPTNDNFKGPFYDGVYYQNRHDRYEGIRVGEYYWMTTNLRNQKTYSDSYDSQQKNVDTYMTHLRINGADYQGLNEKVDPLNPDAEIKYTIFDYYYGRYYHMMNLNGYKVNHWYHEGIDESFKVYYLDGQSKEVKFDGWKVADKQAYQQLIGMCNPSGKSYRVSAIGVRLQLGPLNKNDKQTIAKPWLTNPLAYDLGPSPSQPSWCKTYWFEQNSNIYGFNLMPNGGKIHGGSHYEHLDGFDGWYVYGEEFYQLFYVAKMGWKNGGMDLHDEITFSPRNPDSSGDTESEADPNNWGYSWGTRYGARMARPLTPQELGYEIWYIPGLDKYGKVVEKGMPDFANPYLKITQNVNGQVVKPEKPEDSKLDWQVLPHGYLRGFLSHYEIYDTEKKALYNYEFADYVKMARCVEDTWSMAQLKATNNDRDIEPCDCYDAYSAPYIQDNLKIDAFDDYYYLEHAPNTVFNVYARTNNPEKIAIGLFVIEGTGLSQNLKLAAKISKEYDAETNQYRCIVPSDKVGSGYIIQAYKLDANGDPARDGEGNIATVKRPPNKAEVIDRLPFTIGKDYASSALDESESPIGNLSIIRKDPLLRSSFSIPVDEQFTVSLKDIPATSTEIKIGLFTEISGDLVDQISTTKLSDDKYECIITGSKIVPYRDYILSAYTGDASDNTLKLIDRTSKLLYIDRLPVFVEDSNNWDWDALSTLRSVDLISNQVSALNVSFNPTSSLLSIQTDSGIKKLSVYSISGLRILNISKPASEISLSTLLSGVYIVKVISGSNEVKTLKIVKL